MQTVHRHFIEKVVYIISLNLTSKYKKGLLTSKLTF